MKKKTCFCFIFVAFGLSSSLLAQGVVLPHGKYAVGYRSVPVWYHSSGGDSVKLVLNLWYPTSIPSENKTKLLDYTFNHLTSLELVTDTIRMQGEVALRANIHRWFGQVSNEEWSALRAIDTYSNVRAPFHENKFPLILGRLRVFSTLFTNEYIASNGYVVCMLNPVEDFPPDNEIAYHQQLTNELNYYSFARDHLQNVLKITTAASGLMGFSGSAFSQFITPMVLHDFSAVALLESGVLLEGVGDILSRHPRFSFQEYNAALLFIYNKERFEGTNQYTRFSSLNSETKHLRLVDLPQQHHWDFATEGTLASLYLNTREEKIRCKQIRMFNLMNELIVSFFDYYVKNDLKAFPKQEEILILE